MIAEESIKLAVHVFVCSLYGGVIALIVTTVLHQLKTTVVLLRQ